MGKWVCEGAELFSKQPSGWIFGSKDARANNKCVYRVTRFVIFLWFVCDASVEFETVALRTLFPPN